MNAIKAATQDPLMQSLTIETSRLVPARQNLRLAQQAPAEWLELNYAVEALRINQKTIIVQFVGAASRVGTSTVASGFAKAAALAVTESIGASGMQPILPVLFVDCSPIQRITRWRSSRTVASKTLLEAFRGDSLLLDTDIPSKDQNGVYFAVLGASDITGAMRCSRLDLARLFDLLRGRYSIIVLDCPAASQSFEALSLAPHCDGSLIVLRAAVTRAAALKATRERIERVGGQVLGAVFNRVPRKSSWLFGSRGV